jgi:8-oxo-dGTP diphosphatase
VIVADGKLLACRDAKKEYWYLPGGHLEFGETLDQALRREIKEEINQEVESSSFMTVLENNYSDHNGKHHELNLIYNTELRSDGPNEIRSYEEHFTVEWVLVSELGKIRLLPENVHQYLIVNL